MNITEAKGAIFDLDDTLLDNGPKENPEQWLHAQSRLAAIHEAADKYDLPILRSLTPLENVEAFRTAQTHSIYGAVWSIFYTKQLVAGVDIDESDPLYPVMLQIADRKMVLHQPILEAYGHEVTGASDFIRRLAAHGLANHLAIASMAARTDTDFFINKYQLAELLPNDRVVTLEQITKAKPDPECFVTAFRTLDLPDADRPYVLAFEDNPRGIQSAKAAGLFVCAITTRLDRTAMINLPVPPDLIADSYPEFEQLLGL